MPEGAATSAWKKGRHSSKSSVVTVSASGSAAAGDAILCGKCPVRRDGGMRCMEFRIGEVEGQAASVFECAARRAADGKHIGGAAAGACKARSKSAFSPSPRPDHVALRAPSAIEAGCNWAARRGGVLAERSSVIQSHLMELRVQAKLRRRSWKFACEGSLRRASPNRDQEVGEIELFFSSA